MSPLEKVKNRVPIQNMLTFCHITLSIEISTNLHKNSIYKPVEIKNQIPFPRVFAKMRI